MIVEFHRECLVQLPLPLAQLYSRAYNVKTPQSRHDHTFFLFEAVVKLTAAPNLPAAHVALLSVPWLPLPELSPDAVPTPSLSEKAATRPAATPPPTW